MFGGFGLGDQPLGFPFVPLMQEQPGEAVPEKVTPDDPIDRSIIPFNLGTSGYANQFGAFLPAPASTPWLFWQMRKDAAINLAFVITTTPFIAADRGIEIVDDAGNPSLATEMKEDAEKDLLPIFNEAIIGACESLHFGYWLQEVVWDRKGGRTVPVQLNSVLPTEAILHCNPQRRFTGFQISGEFRDSRYGFLAVNQPHIHPTLGYSRNENAKVDWWRGVMGGLEGDKAERKAAGTQIMLGIPMGSSFTDENGKPLFNQEMCDNVANAAAQNRVFPVPMTPFLRKHIIDKPELANIPAIRFDKIDWVQMGDTIKAQLERQERNDRNKMRCWNRPEREAMEGRHGTNAEAETQGNVAITDSEQCHSQFARQWDAQTMNTWRVTNWGPDAPVLRTVPHPLQDQAQAFLRKLAIELATDTQTGPDLQDNMDQRGLLDRVGVPLVDEAVAAQKKKTRAKAKKTIVAVSGQPNDPLNRGGVDPALNGNGNGHPSSDTEDEAAKAA